MILLDTSVWVDHFRKGDELVIHALESGQAAVHALVTGELACGNLKARGLVLDLLRSLPQIQTASDEEVLFYVEMHQWMGRHRLHRRALAGCSGHRWIPAVDSGQAAARNGERAWYGLSQ